jgi:hypothetical protein
MKVVTSMAYYEPGGRIIAFYQDKPPMPKTTVTDSKKYLKGAATAAKKVETILKQKKDFLKIVNQFPSFSMYDLVKTNPYPFYDYHKTLISSVDDGYLEAPFKESYKVTKKDLLNFYQKVAKYFTIMTLVKNEKTYEEQYSQDLWEAQEIMVDNEFEEDLRRPMNVHVSNQNPIHLRKAFRLATDCLTLIAKDFLARNLFLKPNAFKKAASYSAETFEELINNLKYKKGFLYTSFSYFLLKKKFNFGSLSNDKEVMPYEHIFDILVETYNEGFYSYDNFVQWRNKLKSKQPRPRYKILSKDDNQVMSRIFNYFKETVYPQIVEDYVNTLLMELKESDMFQSAGIEAILYGKSNYYATFKKYMKMIGYIGFSDSDAGLLSYHSAVIFKNK